MSTNRLPSPSGGLSFRLKFLSVVILSASPLASQAQPDERQNSHEAAFRFSAESDLDSPGANRGELETFTHSFGFQHTRPASERLRLTFGIKYEETTIETSAALPLPDSLRAVHLEIGGTYSVTPDWSVTASVRPGVYSDGDTFNSDGFNVPAMLLARWQYSPTLTFLGGALFDSFAEDAVTPFFGLRWQASPRMALTLGAPRTELSYEFRDDHRVFIAASFQGGSYHVDEIPPVNGYPRIRDTEVDYREIIIGAGIAWPLTKRLFAEVEGGWLLDRRFDFNDHGLVLKTDPAPTVRISLSSRF